MKNGKFLTEVLDPADVENTIHKYRVVRIDAGVGSGKNYWANKLLDPKATGGKYYRVLYITSRKATAAAEAQKTNTRRYINLGEILRTEKAFGKLRQCGFTLTNSGVEKFIKNNPEESWRSLVTNLDFIILDEAHSLFTDAVFTSAPFYVERFLKYALINNPSLTVVLMTGTPKYMEKLKQLTDMSLEYDSLLKQRPTGKQTLSYKHYDYMKECNHVFPEQIYFNTREESRKLLEKYLAQGKKVIYFADDIGYIKELWRKLPEKRCLLQSEIAVGFSKEDERGAFEPTLPKAQREEIEEYLKDHEKLPDNIRLLLSTSKYKEGININNDDIQIMMAESLWSSELTQMAGRIRKGVENLHIVYDQRHHVYEPKVAFEHSRMDALFKGLNAGYFEYHEKYGKKNKTWEMQCISLEESIHPLFRFDMLIRHKYLKYAGRYHGELARLESFEKMENAIKNWDAIIDEEYVGETCRIWTGESYLTSVFPFSAVHKPCLKTEAERKQEAKLDVDRLMCQKKWLDSKLQEEVKTEVLQDINRIEEAHSLKMHKQLKRALNAFGYDIKNGSKNSQYANFRIYKQEDDFLS